MENCLFATALWYVSTGSVISTLPFNVHVSSGAMHSGTPTLHFERRAFPQATMCNSQTSFKLTFVDLKGRRIHGLFLASNVFRNTFFGTHFPTITDNCLSNKLPCLSGLKSRSRRVMPSFFQVPSGSSSIQCLSTPCIQTRPCGHVPLPVLYFLTIHFGLMFF